MIACHAIDSDSNSDLGVIHFSQFFDFSGVFFRIGGEYADTQTEQSVYTSDGQVIQATGVLNASVQQLNGTCRYG